MLVSAKNWTRLVKAGFWIILVTLATSLGGSVYYTAPDWQMHNVLEQPQEFDPKGYSPSFCNFSEDLNHDGWADLIVVDSSTWPGGVV